MLYVATLGDQPCFESDLLNVDDVEPQQEAVRQWLTLPVIRFVGAHTGCSCGFRSIKASDPIEFHEGMFGHEDVRDDATQARARASISALLALVREHVTRDGAVELLAVWQGDEIEPPLGTIEKGVDALQPETWFFIEGFLYRITAVPR